MASFPEVFCSQCGAGFGPGDHGFSSCRSHLNVQPSSPAMSTDEMGNPTKTIEVWYVHACCVPANMHPSITLHHRLELAEQCAEDRRADASTWLCVHVTGPHQHTVTDTAKPPHERMGHRVGTPADLGCEAL